MHLDGYGRRAVAAAVALALAWGCGSGGDDEGADGEARDPGAPATTAPAEPVPAEGAATCWTAPPGGGGDGPLGFEDVTGDRGLVEPLLGMYGHAAAAADVDGDGWTDLFVGGFADRDEADYRVRGADGPSPDRLLLGGPDGFAVDDRFPGELARTSGATFADLDGDGDLDLVVARNPQPGDELTERPTTVYENRGDGWSAVAELAPATAARSIAALDVDRDGLTDLLVLGDRFGDGPTRAFRNTGGFAFEDATNDWGVPDDLRGLALATVDLDGDGRLDIVTSGDPRVLLGGPDGFVVEEVPELRWETHGDEDDPAGVDAGDLDGDGRPDLVVGQHFNSTVDDGETVPVRVLLNRSEPGAPALGDVTEEAGSPPLPTKAPHVAVADLDDDGRPDVVTSAVTEDGTPLVLRNTGTEDGVPRLEPTGEAAAGRYWVTGATADLDRDGRLDVFLVAWEPSEPSVLFRATGTAGAWVEVDLAALGPAAAGTRVEATAGDRRATAWATSTTGYAAGAPPVVHLGLGDATGDVEITVTPPGGDPRRLTTPAGSRTSLAGC
ncbi:MAG: CRTAC1 family protein [Acidimicrobiia bacterium]